MNMLFKQIIIIVRFFLQVMVSKLRSYGYLGLLTVQKLDGMLLVYNKAHKFFSIQDTFSGNLRQIKEDYVMVC